MSNYTNPKITEITGTITLSDGSTSKFSISCEGWQQWGAITERLGKTVDAMEAMTNALAVDDLFYTDDDDDDDDEDEDEDE